MGVSVDDVAIVVGAVHFERRHEASHVIFDARNLRAGLRLEKVGHGNGREDGDDGHHDQKFDEGEGF